MGESSLSTLFGRDSLTMNRGFERFESVKRHTSGGLMTMHKNHGSSPIEMKIEVG